jgi:deoxyribonuclease V
MTLAAAVQVSYEDLSLIKARSVEERTRFPYIPGLLAFREAPAVLRAIRRLHAKEYTCLVDGHGVAHPRRFGLACFVGLALDCPTVGVAKSLLCGRLSGKRVVDGSNRPLAEAVRTPSGKTIYVSVGHKISLEDAVKIVERSMGPSGPTPITLAHMEVTKQKWQLRKSKRAS